MNRDILAGKWKELKGGIKEKWGKLTDDELDQASGRFDQLSGLLQQRYGYAKDQAERELDSYLDSRKERSEPTRRS